jgi:hypothetical protein
MSKGYLIGRRGVAALKRLVNSTATKPTGDAGVKIIEARKYPLPFTVRWSTEANGWMIALGDITYGGVAVSVSNHDVEPIEGFGPPWRKLSSLSADDSGTLYLNISGLPKEDDSGESEGDNGEASEITADFTFGKNEDADLSIRIATVEKDDSGAVKIIQYVTSSLHLGGGSAGAAGGEMLHPYKVRFSEEFWSWEIYLPTEECLVIGDVPVSITGDLQPSPAENGWYVLAIPEDASEIRLNGEPGSDSELTLTFSAESNDPENYPNRFSYLIAKVDAHRVTGQNITSAIHRSGGRQVWVDPGDGETA